MNVLALRISLCLASFGSFQQLSSQQLVDAKALTEQARHYEIGDNCPRDAGKAWLLYRQAAALGDPKAMVALGDMLDEGKCVDQDMAQALSWFRRAADADDAIGMARYARMYEQGRGILRSVETAEAWYRKAAEHGHPASMTKVAELANDPDWLRRAVAAGDPPAFSKLAEFEPDEASQLYAKGAALGDPSALFAVGRGLESSDVVEAASYYRRAAEGGHEQAMAKYAQFAEKGLGGVTQSVGEALVWYRKAAAQGEPISLTYLGRIVEETDPDQAMRLYKRAVDAGYGPAMTRLGNMRADCVLFQGAAEAGDADGMFALASKCEGGDKWYQQAADCGQPDALAKLGRIEAAAEAGHIASMLAAGKKDRRFWKRAAELGNSEGMRLYGLALADPIEGSVWIQRAAEKGNAAALAEAGIREKDPAQARKWFEAGAKAGSVECMYRLGALDSNVDLLRSAADGGSLAAMVKLGEITQDRSWWQRAAAAGYGEAFTRLGDIERGAAAGDSEAKLLLAEKRKPREAYALIRELADGGYAPAMRLLGDLHLEGKGTSRSEVDAVGWYRKAAYAGDTRAREKLEKMGKL